MPVYNSSDFLRKNMNCMNLITAINDQNLHGDCLMVPLRLSVQAFRRPFSACPVNQPLIQKLSEIFKRAMFLIASVGVIPAIPLAMIGIAVKWMDLGLRINQLVHKGPAMGYHLPMILKIFSRLGDRTVAYLNTKCIAEKYNLPVHFVPFKGCENFRFSQEEALTGPRYFKKVVRLKNAEDIEALARVNRDESTLYQLPFFPHTRDLQEEGSRCSYIKYATDWASFRARVGELLTVIKPHTQLNIPEGAYSVALHIRDGGTFDDGKTKTMHPLKLPPMNFYVGELRRVLTSNQIPQGMPVFIHIFTDAVDPKKVRDVVQASLSGLDLQGRAIQLSYSENASLSDDIANMSRFKCMIRADSNLSGPIAEGSRTLELEVFPTHFKVDPKWKEISISQVRIVTHRNDVRNVETDYPKKVVKGGLPICFFRKFHDYFGIIQSKSS